MKFFIRCLLTAFIAVLCENSYAQTAACAIQGKVLTDSRLPAEASTIVLLASKDSSVISSAIIGKSGIFQFKALKPDNYLLLVTTVGYIRSYTGPYKLMAGQTIIAPDIVLVPSANQLKEVSVVSTKPDIEVKNGVVILNIQNSLIASGNSVFDVLRQSPGVKVYNNDISIIGRQSALITIDGKPSNLSGEDLVAMLRSTQSNMVDRIELSTSGSAKYDASSGGIINIVLKKGKATGANAILTTSAGYGSYGKGNAGLVFNDRTSKINIFGNYSYAADKSFHNFVTNRDITYNNILSQYDVGYKSTQQSHNNTFGLGTDFFLSPNHTIGFLVNGFSRKDAFVKNDNLAITNQSVLDSVIKANSTVERKITQVNYNVNYNGKLDAKGTTLSADLNYTTYKRTSNEYITNDFFTASGNTYRNPLLLQNISPSDIKVRLAKVDFTDPLSKTTKLEVGLKYSKATSTNDLVFGPKMNGQYQVDPAFSSHFVYNENVNAAYVNLISELGKIDLTTSLRAEQTIAKASGNILDRNYLDLFPQAQIDYHPDDKHDYTLSYSHGIKRPDYQEINPFLYYVDLYDYRSGNPALKPNYSNNIELSYNYNKTIVTTLYANIISDAYEFNFYEQNDASKVNVSTNINLGTVYNYGLRFFTPAKFASWWNASFNADIGYQRYVAYPGNGNLNKGTQDIILNTTQRFVIAPTFSAELTGNYETPSFYGVNQFKANYSVNGALSKQLFEKRATLRFGVLDIFNTKRDRSHTDYENLDMTIVDKRESRIARLTFTYRFGKTTAKSVAHRTGNEDEQKRTGAKGDN